MNQITIFLIFGFVVLTYVECYNGFYGNIPYSEYDDNVPYVESNGPSLRNHYGLRASSHDKCGVLLTMSPEEENALNIVFSVSSEQAYEFCIAFFECSDRYENLEEKQFLSCKDEACKVIHGNGWIWDHEAFHCAVKEEMKSEPKPEPLPQSEVVRSYYPYFY
ncbi:uncharacterized protein LOC123298774 [Chrysoperla carnea]|uniref:uncharacterized protein LOC123298774 n=1 Tax=Chrysoperla carnea TaxID=189513 RepID=UPI001D06DF37|nr:uncharacterized protein LOC123298774 [Chrysoperla carnea]